MSIFTCETFRTIGSASTAQNIFSIWNGSSKSVLISRLVLQLDCTVTLTAVMPIIRASRISSNPTDGITLIKSRWDTGASISDPSIIVKGECSSDGGVRTPLVSTPQDTIWQQYGMRLHTAVGQILGNDNSLLPIIAADQPFVLRNNEGLVVNINAAIGTSNPATNHYFVQCLWKELPFYRAK